MLVHINYLTQLVGRDTNGVEQTLKTSAQHSGKHFEFESKGAKEETDKKMTPNIDHDRCLPQPKQCHIKPYGVAQSVVWTLL